MVQVAAGSGPAERERHRAAVLSAYAILDSPPEAVFDAITRLAASICGTPMAAFSFLDGDRQWFKSEIGLGMAQTGRDVSFCDHAARDPRAVLEVTDTRVDPRFADNGLVTGAPHIRFYAGAPLAIDGGADAVGALCVLDREPRTLTAAQRGSLVDLSGVAMSLLNDRLALRNLTAASDDALKTTVDELDAAQRLSQLGSWASDFQTGHVHWSEELHRILGVPTATPPSFELFTELVIPADRGRLRDMAGQPAAGRAPTVLHVRRPDGQERVVEAQLEFLTGDDGTARGVVGTTRDVTDQHQLQSELLRRATTDALTGLPHRTAVLEELAQVLAADRAAGRPTAVLVLSIADFRSINEAFGVTTADQLLRLLAGMLRAGLPDSCVLARTGDGQFACVLPGTSAQSALDIGNGLQQSFTGRPLVAGRVSVTVELASGVSARNPRARSPRDASATHEAHDLLRRAVIACGVSENRPNRPTVKYEAKWRAAASRRAKLYEALRQAVERDELTVAYQPLVDLAAGTILGAEALVRWDHHLLGRVPPPEFIPIAEQSGLIDELGRLVLRSACREAARWRPAAGKEPVGISVNFSGYQLATDAVVDVVRDALAESGLDPGRLTVELTETVLMGDPARIAQRLESLTTMGLKIAIDDFGTGYSSLAYLAQFPVHTLKIDKSFVDDLDVSERNRTIVAAILRLGDALEVTTLAEGIETPQQRATLLDLGCERGQGYLFSRPVPAQDLRHVLNATQTLSAPPSRSRTDRLTLHDPDVRSA